MTGTASTRREVPGTRYGTGTNSTLESILQTCYNKITTSPKRELGDYHLAKADRKYTCAGSQAVVQQRTHPIPYQVSAQVFDG